MKKSITSIEKVYNTRGSFPVLVLCDDLEFYVVKYTRDLRATNLFNEYLGSSFLKLWELGTPNFDFVDVLPKHIPFNLHFNIQPSFFNVTCFGTKFSKSYSDITNFLVNSSTDWINKFLNKQEILMITLFDIWLSNEDRNFNNPNLMYDLANQNRFIPIDHQYLFNSSNLEHGLTQLTFNESILSHPLTKKLFRNDEIRDKDLIDTVKDKYYICIEKCMINLKRIVDFIPIDWNIDTIKYQQFLEKTIFSEKWIDACWETFLSFITIHQNLKN